jgi:hypothetical protein
MKKTVRQAHQEFTAIAAGYDCTIHLPETTGNDHFKWLIEHASGARLAMITSQTPSDRRAKQKRISTLKQLCRQLVEESRSTV